MKRDWLILCAVQVAVCAILVAFFVAGFHVFPAFVLVVLAFFILVTPLFAADALHRARSRVGEGE